MRIPHKLLVLGATAVAVHLLRRRRRGQRDAQRSKPGRPEEESHSATVVHAFPSASPSEAGSPQVTSLQQKSSSNWASLAVLLLASGVIAAVVGLAAVRNQSDLAVAIAASWLVVVVAQVLQQRSELLQSGSTSGLQEADLQVEVADVAPLKVPEISGTWIKDTAASDSMEAAMRLIHLNGMMRTAVRLIRGVKIGLDEQHFHFGVFSVISWFKIYEHYTLGEVCLNRRRDLRRGKSSGLARITPHGSVRLEYEWGSPFGGRGVDEFRLDAQGRLVIACTIYVDDESASYTHVYNRKQ